MDVDSVVIIAILSMSYITIYYHSKNIDKCGENPQSACRKPNNHTECAKNCYKILFVWYRKAFRSEEMSRNKIKI